MKKRFLSLSMFVLLLFLSFAQPILKVESVKASGIGQITQDFAEKMAYAYCSIVGAVNSTANGVGKVSGNIISALTTKISELWGTGIYEDANGNIVWSGEATQEFYETLLGSNDIDARAIGSFYGTTPYGGLYGLESPYFQSDVRNFANSGRSLYTDYLAVVTFSSGNNNGSVGSNVSVASAVTFYDLSNVAYLVCSVDSYNRFVYNFYNSSGALVRVKSKDAHGSYYGTNGFSNVSYSDETYTNKFMISSGTYYSSTSAYESRNNIYFKSFDNYVFDLSSCFLNFPFYGDNSSLVWSNKSLIIGKDPAYGLSKYNQNTGIIVNNEYNQMPTITNNDIDNNNWNTIYNNYITNVQNEGDEYITENGIDPPALRKIIKKYTDVITDAIEEGNDDIEGAINYTNEWLKKIYERLGLIYDKMDNLSSGGSGGSCPWTDEDIESIIDGLDRIDSNLALQLTEMQKIYTYLGTLLEAIEDIECGGDGKNITTIVPIITDLPDTDVLDFIDTGDVLADLVGSVVPFCFVAFAVGLADKLAAQPVTPSFSIPVQLNSEFTGAVIDESIDIDFADFENSGFGFIHSLITSAWCISWIIMLIWLTFNLLESFNLIFG